MNFHDSASPYNMPELGWRFGYFYALALMLTVAIGMIIFFRRKKMAMRASSNQTFVRVDQLFWLEHRS